MVLFMNLYGTGHEELSYFLGGGGRNAKGFRLQAPEYAGDPGKVVFPFIEVTYSIVLTND